MNLHLPTMTRVAARGLLYIRKYSPEILLGLGITGFVGTNVLSSRASLKLEDALAEMSNDLKELEEAQTALNELTHLSVAYTERDYKIDLTRVYVRNTVRLVKLYAPSVVVGGLSIAALIGSHKILKDRNVALLAAYQAVSTAYKNYRGYVREDLGVDADRKYAYGLKEIDGEVTSVDKDGKEVTETKKMLVSENPSGYSPYARWFDEKSLQWCKDNLANLAYLRGQQHYINDLLQNRGHVFLNEVYDAIGVPRSKEGAIVGWVLRGPGDGFVDFGMFDSDHPGSQQFINGWTDRILLDFNVDGVIYDKI